VFWPPLRPKRAASHGYHSGYIGNRTTLFQSPPEDDDAYVSGDVILARIERRGEEVLKPTLKIRDRKASETGDYEVVDFSKLKFESDSTEPRARAYIRGNNTFNLNDDKVIELTEAGSLRDSD